MSYYVGGNTSRYSWILAHGQERPSEAMKVVGAVITQTLLKLGELVRYLGG